MKYLRNLTCEFIIGFVFALVFCLSSAQSLSSESGIKRIELVEYIPGKEVQLGIGNMIESGMVQPRAAITDSEDKGNKWILQRPQRSGNFYWPQDLLTARPGSLDLTIDPRLIGLYDIYVQVRAVRLGGRHTEMKDFPSMAFGLGLDDKSQQEIVGATGFPEYHYDTEILAAYHWNLTNRKLILRNLNKPVYIYGFRFVPAMSNEAADGNEQPGLRKIIPWLASDHVTIAQDSDKHFAFPGVAKLKNGDIMVVFREATKHTTDKSGKIALSRSNDGGRTWLPRTVLLDLPGDDRDPGIHAMSDGTLIVTSSGRMLISGDSGYTWSRPMPTPVLSPHGVVEDEWGNILYGGQETIQNDFTKIDNKNANLLALSVYRSKNRGQSWDRVGIATHTLYKSGPENYLWQREPSLCVVPNKMLIMATANYMAGDGFIRIIRSLDRGKTWGPTIVTPVRGKPAHLLWLGGSRLLMTYSYRYPPWGVRGCLSYDNGETWDINNEIILRMDGGTPKNLPRKVGDTDLGYPVSVRLSNNLIFTVYYLNKEGSNAFIEGTFWELP